ncbi:hypothetical protein SG34_002300 [Thalassomonas viridans]|uniref:Uncharacterized protein n=1 Tax=Thalassomonas viridans TaxID=137584 RepID=A0AAF0CA09_9GAMM|nr:hypothetical protein [Thalassomonas viridans]WDE05790.1 hypothetical protein SG34_002300 [Thalassomonas viridans]
MSDSNNGNHEKELASQALALCDDFNKFSEQCAFLCDAFSAIVRDPACIDEACGDGLGHHSYWLKVRVMEFRDRIEELHHKLRD